MSCKDIFAAETRLLHLLDFNVFAPSIVVYLETYFFDLAKQECPIEQAPVDRSTLPPWKQQQYFLALFLMYLLSLDVSVIHSFRHPSVLVSACVLTAAFNLQLPDVQVEFPDTIAKLTNLGFVDPRKDDLEQLVRDTSILWAAKLDIYEEDVSVASVVKLFDCEKRMYASKIVPRPMRHAGASGG